MKKSNRARKVGLAAGVATLATMAFGAASASALPVTVTHNDAALKIGALSPFDVLEPPNVSTMNGDVDAMTGDVDIPAANFVFPDFSGEPITGVTVEVELDAVEEMDGTANPATGDVAFLPTEFHVNVVGLGADCNYNADMQFTTGDGVTLPGGSPAFPGDPYTVALGNPVVLTNGAIQTAWPAGHFPPDMSAGCTPGGDQTINGLVGGAGSLALANGIDLTPVPPAVPDPPAGSGIVPKTDTGNNKQKTKKKCKKKKKKGKSASTAAKGKNCGKKKKK
jgi:hypothetical protein